MHHICQWHFPKVHLLDVLASVISALKKSPLAFFHLTAGILNK